MSHEQVDTRVTAYIFSELSAQETIAFERELKNSPALQEEVAATREAIGALKSEFQSQASGLSDTQRQTIEQAIQHRSSTPPSVGNPPPVVTPPPVVSSTPMAPAGPVGEGSYRSWAVTAILAACVLIVVGLAFPFVRSRTPATISMTATPPPGTAAIEPTTSSMQSSETSRQLLEDELPQQQRPLVERPAGRAEIKPLGYSSGPATSNQPASSPATSDGQAIEGYSGKRVAGIAEEPATASGRVSKRETAERELREQPAKGALAASSSRLSISEDADMSNAEADFGMDPYREYEMDAYQSSMPMPPEQREKPQRRTRRRTRSSGQEAGMMMGMGEEMGMEEMGMGGMGMEMEMMMEMEMEDEMGMMEMEFGGQGDRFEPINDNSFVDVQQSPLSTFSVDVDTASYAKVRSMLNQRRLPRPDAVRIEELLNYFDYDYPAPKDEHPFAASMEITDCPWSPQHRLARIGIKGKVIETNRPSSNLVFLLDVSGSMDEANKLPLVIEGMKMLTDQLTENDKVAIVVYAGAAGLVLDATRGDRKHAIVTALDRLKAGGSTNGGQGIQLAYEIARDNFIVGGTNRVILCSDGDFNVGVTGTDQLVQIAKDNAKSNIFLSVLGFGTGNHNDSMMEQISNQGNGNYAFIDNKAEARKVLVEELGGTLVTIAKDVKIQIEFNPKEVASYRLIGYENRVLAAQDFNDDKKDAGEIGAGHTVTALYEIVPAIIDDADVPPVGELRYQKQVRLSSKAESGEVLVLKLRYKQPDGDTSTLIEFPVEDSGKRFAQADRDFKFAAAVASFGMLLRDSPHRGNANFDRVTAIASEAAKGDDNGYRTEFLELVIKARTLRGE